MEMFLTSGFPTRDHSSQPSLHFGTTGWFFGANGRSEEVKWAPSSLRNYQAGVPNPHFAWSGEPGWAEPQCKRSSFLKWFRHQDVMYFVPWYIEVCFASYCSHYPGWFNDFCGPRAGQHHLWMVFTCIFTTCGKMQGLHSGWDGIACKDQGVCWNNKKNQVKYKYIMREVISELMRQWGLRCEDFRWERTSEG